MFPNIRNCNYIQEFYTYGLHRNDTILNREYVEFLKKFGDQVGKNISLEFLGKFKNKLNGNFYFHIFNSPTYFKVVLKNLDDLAARIVSLYFFSFAAFTQVYYNFIISILFSRHMENMSQKICLTC